MTLDIVEETTLPTTDPVLVKLDALEETITQLVETIAELSEKVHDVERDIAYALGER